MILITVDCDEKSAPLIAGWRAHPHIGKLRECVGHQPALPSEVSTYFKVSEKLSKKWGPVVAFEFPKKKMLPIGFCRAPTGAVVLMVTVLGNSPSLYLIVIFAEKSELTVPVTSAWA